MAKDTTIELTPALLGIFMTGIATVSGAAGYYVQSEATAETTRQLQNHDRQEHAHPNMAERQTIIEQTVKNNKEIAEAIQSSNEKEHREIQQKLDKILEKLAGM